MAMKKQKKTQFSIRNSLHLLAGISFTCSLFFSDIHSLCSSTVQFLLVSLPCIWSSFFNPKCLFVVVNVIVIFLVGESGVVGSKKPSVACDVYNEYIKRNRGQVRAVLVSNEPKRMECKEEQGFFQVKEMITCESESPEEATCANIAEENEKEIVEEETLEIAEEIHEREVVEGETFETAEDINGREIVEDEQVVELPVEELNKRVEEFIARVNKQRRDLIFSWDFNEFRKDCPEFVPAHCFLLEEDFDDLVNGFAVVSLKLLDGSIKLLLKN